MHGCVMRHSGWAQHSRTRSSPGAAREGVVRVRACLAAGAGAVAGGRCCDAGCADRPGQPVVAFLSLLAEARTNVVPPGWLATRCARRRSSRKTCRRRSATTSGHGASAAWGGSARPRLTLGTTDGISGVRHNKLKEAVCGLLEAFHSTVLRSAIMRFQQLARPPAQAPDAP